MKNFLKVFTISFFSMLLVTNTNNLLLGIASSIENKYKEDITKMDQSKIKKLWSELTDKQKISFLNHQLENKKIIFNNPNFDILFFNHIQHTPVLVHNKKTSEVYLFDITKVSGWKVKNFILASNIKKVFQLSKTIIFLVEKDKHIIYFFDFDQSEQKLVEKTNFTDKNFDIKQHDNLYLTTFIYDKNNNQIYWFSALEPNQIGELKIKISNTFWLTTTQMILVDENTKQSYFFDINFLGQGLQKITNWIKMTNNFSHFNYHFSLYSFYNEKIIFIHYKKIKKVYLLNIDQLEKEEYYLPTLSTKIFDEIHQMQDILVLIEAKTNQVYWLKIKNINDNKELIPFQKSITTFIKMSDTIGIFHEKNTGIIYLLDTTEIETQSKGLKTIKYKTEYLRKLKQNVLVLIEKDTNKLIFFNSITIDTYKKCIATIANIIWLKNQEVFLQEQKTNQIYWFINNQIEKLTNENQLKFLKTETNYIVKFASKIIIRDEKTDKIYLLEISDLTKGLISLSDKKFSEVNQLSNTIAILITKYSNSVYLFNENDPSNELIDLNIKSDKIGTFENGTVILPDQDNKQVYVININEPNKKEIVFDAKKFNSIRYLSNTFSLLIEAETNQVYLLDVNQLKKELIIFPDKKFIKSYRLSSTMVILTESETNQYYLFDLTKINEPNQGLENLNIEILSLYHLRHWASPDKIQIIILIEKITKKIYLLSINKTNHKIIDLKAEIEHYNPINNSVALIKTQNPEEAYWIDASDIDKKYEGIKKIDLEQWKSIFLRLP